MNNRIGTSDTASTGMSLQFLQSLEDESICYKACAEYQKMTQEIITILFSNLYSTSNDHMLFALRFSDGRLSNLSEKSNIVYTFKYHIDIKQEWGVPS